MLRADLKRTTIRRAATSAACAIAACLLAWSGEANAQTAAPADLRSVLAVIQQQEQRLDAQERLLHDQQRQISEQRTLIERQRHALEQMAQVSDVDLGEIRGAGMPSSALNFAALADEPIRLNRGGAQRQVAPPESGGGAVPTPASATAPPDGPVGEAPPEDAHPATTVEALPEGQNALLGHGRLVIEPSIEYSRSSSNRLVFRGVEIVTGVQVGLLEANDTARDTLSGALDVRYALTDRLEVEARVPYVYRHDRVTTVAQQSTSTTRTFELEGSDIGDVEVSARYQLNRGRNGAPLFVLGGRVKSNSGLSPFDLQRDQFGVSTELATGSGFWGVQGSLSMLYPSDPVVLFGNISYLYNIADDVNADVGTAHIGRVDPGDSIGVGFGFGFALNPRFSYSLGYSHAYITETETEINGTTQRSVPLQVGTLQFGMSFRATPRLTLSTGVDIGVTDDAPDVRVSLRAPFRW